MRGGCIPGFWTQGFSTIYSGEPVASQFGQMVNRIQDWWVLIPLGNRVYDCLSQFRLMKNDRESLKLIFKKGLKTRNPNFRLEVSNQENSRIPFQTFRFLEEFSTETSKATRNWVNGKPHVAFFQFWELARVKTSKRTIAPILSRRYLIPSRKLVFINQMAFIGDDLIRKYLANISQKFIQ